MDKKYPLPIACPKGVAPVITQLFGDTSSVDWYQANGLNLTAHNGVDFIVGNPIQTYGTRLVCPFPQAELSQTWWNNAMSTSGNGIQIAIEFGNDRYNIRFWHCSRINTKSTYKEGEDVAYIGNSGLCRPAPSYSKPFDGSHLHLMVYKNGVLIDPLTVFDETKWFVQEDTGPEYDMPPLKWSLDYISLQIKKLWSIIFKK